MAGVKVTMVRCDSSGRLPAERLFEDATYWVFASDHPGGTLNIMKQEGVSATASPSDVKRTTIAEFPAGGIESVEFV